MTDTGVAESCSSRRQRIDVWRFDQLVAVTAERTRRLIVSEKKDDVWTLGRTELSAQQQQE